MKRKCLIIIAFVLQSIFCSFAQSGAVADVYGNIQGLWDGGLKKELLPLPGVTVVLSAGPDTLYTTTNQHGIFIFKGIQTFEIKLKLMLLGKKTIENRFELEPGRNAFFFTMEDSSEELSASTVSAEGELMKKIADTTVFNTRLLNALDGENARALLEQLPGFKIEGARITVDGEEIKRTYVNGVLVFGDNPTTAIDALRANELTAVRVYDEYDRVDTRRGITHGKKERVLDIKTQESIISLTDAVAMTEVGADEIKNIRHQALGSAAFWSEMFNASAMAGENNISSDLQEIVMDFQMTPLEIARSAQARTSPLNNESKNLAAKLNMSKYWKDRNYGNKVSGSYTYGKNYLRSVSQALTQYYETDINPAIDYYDTTSNTSKTKRHLFSINAELFDTPLKSISLLAYGSITSQEESNRFIEKIVSEQTRLKDENSSSSRSNYDVSLHAGWTDNDHRRFKPALNFDATISKENLISWVTDTLKSSYSRRHLHTDGNGSGQDITATGSLSVTVINDETRSLFANILYKFNYRNQVKKQFTVDYIDPAESITSIGGSFDYTWNYANNMLSLDGTYSSRNLTLSGGLAFMSSIMSGENRFPTVDPAHKAFNYLLPNFSVRYKNMMFDFGTTAALPALEQIRAYISDSNPMILSAGNPGLNKSYTSLYKFRWSKQLDKNNGRLLLSSEGRFTTSPIVSSSRYFPETTTLSDYYGYIAPAGSILYTYDNASTPSWDITASASYYGVFCKRKLTTQLNLFCSYNSIPQYAGDRIIGANDLNAGISSTIRINPTKKLKISCFPQISYRSSSNYAGTPISESVSVSAPLTLKMTFFKSCYLNVTNRFGYNHYISGFGNDITTNFLSATVGRRFFDNKLTVSISANDLLGSSTKYLTESTAQYYKQEWTPAFGRYYLLSIIYEFRKKQ